MTALPLLGSSTGAALPSHPAGWYVPAFSDELRPGAVLTRRFMGRDLVLFRTASGVASAIDAHCPHLGAHLGEGGTVVGETLRCPFHGFCFDTSGECVKTPYEGRLPKGRARMPPVREDHGVILVHHDESGAPPAWEVPTVDASRWTRLLHDALTLRAHPQDTTENSVDVGHFSVVHGYENVHTVKPLHIDGAYLTTRYGMRRPSTGLSRFFAEHPVEFEVHVHGLGYSRVEIEVPTIGLRAHQFVLSTPSDPGFVTLRLATAIDRLARSSDVHPLAALLPRALLSAVLTRVVHNALLHDVRQDERIWKHKQNIERPMLAEGDGPIGPYRRWARQFHGATATQQVTRAS